MDAISDPAFQNTKSLKSAAEELPSLLTVIVDTTPKVWAELDKESGQDKNLINALQSLIVFLNAHLTFNSANQVCVIAAHSAGTKYLYPTTSTSLEEEASLKRTADLKIINSDMYRQFRNVDETVLEELYNLMQEEKTRDEPSGPQKSTLSGAMSAGFTYINRTIKEQSNTSLKARLMVLTCGSSGGKDEVFQYIPIMNCIFTATKIKCPIDVVKIGGSQESTFLQQATDATNGIYLHVPSTEGLIQYLTTAMFIDPSLRPIIVKPNQGSVDFRTSCYLTGRVVAVGYVCSVCLCVLSIIPPGNKCPACDSEFDEHVTARLKRRPVVPGVAAKKRRSL
ncbi:LANO_0E06282g1_1 [Lachancea nothofagi CBS 11611]|uniref:General transcription and DNA repair factor IIH subunit TFB4 n=1 Tax=Lachancea nothofagi CBS 11611 TaxID=1266666 RepID=A0A1G4JTQ1_9SACH|nr:LANO_0E06282g1_1 [Lachancea nothofagi CBS 11611]